MKTKNNIVLVGGGGHCKVVIDAIESSGEFNIYGVVDPSLPKGEAILNIEILGDDDLLPEIFRKGITHAFIGVGSIGNCDTRRKISKNLKEIGFKLPVIKHPKAIVSKYVEFGEGTFVAAGAVINAGAKIGKNVIINTSSSVDHDCEIGDFVHIAPGAILSGGVKIGDGAHIGTGAKIVQYVNIKENSFIKAGSLITESVIK